MGNLSGPVIPKEVYEHIRTLITLSSVAAKFLQWDTRKSNPPKGDYWAKCPIHDDPGSSFHIDDRQGFYYCFGCHAKGDVVSFFAETKKITLQEAAYVLASRIGYRLDQAESRLRAPDFGDLLDVKDFIVANFTQEHFLELGVQTGWSNYITNHQRLLRSLSWGDPDYSGCVMEMLSKMGQAADGSIEKLKLYLDKRFAREKSEALAVSAFQASEKYLGYRYETPRNDIISVMMPFSPTFAGVYEAVSVASAGTTLSTKRADQVWNHSAVINDILSLINHSAVVVCDLTGRNENVFYELGIAHAWGKPVVPITQNESDVPFDLRHHRYLKYLNNEEGRKKLTNDLSVRLVDLVGRSSMAHRR